MGSGASLEAAMREQGNTIAELRAEMTEKDRRIETLLKEVDSLKSGGTGGAGGGMPSRPGRGGRGSMIDLSGGSAAVKKGGAAHGSGEKKVRRGEISAEVFEAAGGAGSDAPYEKKTVPKDDEDAKLIKAAMEDNMLFSDLRAAEKADILDAFFKVKAEANQKVIRQGEMGDNFYVVASGALDILVSRDGGAPIKYSTVGRGKSFGELSLMYNCPRAATVQAAEESVLWALDRGTFRAIVTHHKKERKSKYEEFLAKVPILRTLNKRQLAQMADAMEDDRFEEGQRIIRQGEAGDHFYIIEDGEVDVLKREEGKGAEEKVGHLTRGDFFGEKALLTEEKRAATILATTPVTCLSMNRTDFVALLGSLQELIDGGGSKEEEEVAAPSVAAVEGGKEEDSSKEAMYSFFEAIPFEELTAKATIGCGAFGRVKLVKHETSGKTYALKCLVKNDIVKNNLQEHVMNELRVMMDLDHPFILKLHNTYKDSRYVYFLLELGLGGELFTFLRRAGRFSENQARFYAASVVSAFRAIHARNIAYRDLKPENLILDDHGFVKVIDFGLAKVVKNRTWTLCGTPDYLAPEIILSKGHDKSVDYWALGILIYEMVAGFVPFYADDPMEVYQLILAHDLRFPSHFTRPCCDLIQKLLHPTPSKRLGNLRGGVRDILKHKWFTGFDWTELVEMRMRPPIVPVVKSKDDVSNFDRYPEEDPLSVPECLEWDPEF
eukprot:PLAT5565.1.p1 GENE.PLAT5565.1~~PLAT5565.1.p1  ORF type:complete len:720 (-),score=419.53 PLAT5565.1:286-2445(-)